VAAIELISPGNKDRSAERRAFAVKCASYLFQGIGLIIVDIVTSRRANLHKEILHVMEAADAEQLAAEVFLYAVAYQPLRHDSQDQINVWCRPLALNQLLPTLPLSLRADLVIPLDLEATYAEACRRKRLTAS
jgi:transcriptional regulator of met regulon